MSWAFVQKVSPPMCSALMCHQQRRTAPTYSGLSFGCCACPTQAPNAVSNALSSSRWVFVSPSPVSQPRIAWLLNGCLNWYMQSHRREREKNVHAVTQVSSLYAVIRSPSFPFTVWCYSFPTWKGSPSSVEQLWLLCHICMCRTLGSFIPLTVAIQLVLIQWMELSVLSLIY